MNPIAVPLLALTLGHVFSNAVRTLPAVATDVLTRDLVISAETLAAITSAVLAGTKCINCNGTGWSGPFRCVPCKGTGEYPPPR